MTMESRLKTLEQSLIPSKYEITSGKKIMDEIFTSICKRSKYTIVRTRLLGSTEKKTSIAGRIDFDCVIYVEDCYFPFTEVIDDFENILTQKFRPESYRVTNHGLAAISIQGVKFDIMVATNFLTGKQIESSTRQRRAALVRAKAQANGLLCKIKQSDNAQQMAKDNSAGFSELAVEYVKKKSAYCHELARICKYWNSNLPIETYVSGRSSIIELLALQSGVREEKMRKRQNLGKRSLLRGFKRFLEDMRDIKNLNRTFYCFFYHNKDVPIHIRQQRPLLLDPSNPYNNFLDIDRKVMEQFSDLAKETLRKISRDEWPF